MARHPPIGSSSILLARISSIRLAVLIVAVLTIGFYLLPIRLPQGTYSRVLLDRDNKLLGAEVAHDDEQWRFPPIHHIAPKYKKSLLTFEDRWFYQHPGVNLSSILRAFWSNLRAGKVVSGASTITMQVVRMARKNPPRTLVEKMWEILLAFRLEWAFSKDELLIAYASHAPFGGNTVGLQAAAWRYFKRSASELSWAEAATLAVLPNSPSLIHPGRRRNKLKNKRDRLLRKLGQLGHLSPVALKMALIEPLPQPPGPLPQLSPHFLHSFVAPQTILRSTLSHALQTQALQRIHTYKSQLSDLGVENAAALIIHVPTAEVVAYIGNIGELNLQQNGSHIDMNRSHRSTGSLLKPFLYGRMLDSGELLPSQLVPDVPVRMGGFRPENFDRDYRGAVAADKALAWSLNIPAVIQLKRYGLGRLMNELRTAGLTHLRKDPTHYGLSFILGGAEATPLELATLYTQLAFIASGLDRPWPGLLFGTERLPAYPLPIRAGAAYLTVKALYGARNSRPNEAHQNRIAWKTGTSFGFRDAWAIGVTPAYVVTVWTGNADGEGRPNLTGTRAATPILFSLFALLPPSHRFEPPLNDLDIIEVCGDSGFRAGPRCHHRRQQLVTRGSISQLCPHCQIIPSTRDRQFRVHTQCARLDEIYSNNFFVLPARQEHFFVQKNPQYVGLPRWRAACKPTHSEQKNLAVLFPQEHTQVYVPVDLNGQPSRVVCKATHRDPQARLFWYLDQIFLGETKHFHEYELAPTPGPHTLTVVDTLGETEQRQFTIISPHRESR
ncbi:MAG: penicillin-binding protein 1C [Myxococcales bacterium]|nr:penicillin-binding protein 1C [Myxococcales bacterium]